MRRARSVRTGFWGVTALAAITLSMISAPAFASSAAPTAPLPQMGDYPASDYTAPAAALPPELVLALDRDLGVSAEAYLAGADAAADAIGVVAGIDASGVEVLGSRIDGTTLVVNVATAEDAAIAESTGAVAEVGAPAEVDLTGVTFSPAVDTPGGLGYSWSTTSSGFRCSLAFAGFATDGTSQFATAGHCTNAMATITGSVNLLSQDAPTYNGGTTTVATALGTPVAGSTKYGLGYDSGLIAATGTGIVATPSVATWGGGTGAPLSSAPLAVTGQTAGIVGATLCKSGSTTGWSCGTITAVDTYISVLDDGVTYPINSILATTCIRSGDSGGAALVGQYAVGITSSSTTTNCADADYTSAFFPMLSTKVPARESVATAYGANWELALTVAAPAVTANVGGTVTTPGSLSGTLASPSATHTVRLYLDGSSTAFATVSAASGTWTIPMTGVAAGSHSYSLVASAGTRSFSAASTGTFTAGLPAATMSAPNGVSPAATSFVVALYNDVLGRSAGSSEIAGWGNALMNGYSSFAVASGFVNSDEYRLMRINAAYQTILGRSAEAGGANGWLLAMQRGALGTDDVEKTFYASDEYKLNSGNTVDSFVIDLYSDLLHRTPAATEVAGWVALANTHGRGIVVNAFWNAPETARERVSAMYLKYLGRYPDAAGLDPWATLSITQGDAAVRWGIVGSPEYWSRAGTRFPAV